MSADATTMAETGRVRRDRRNRLESDEPGIVAQPPRNIRIFFAVCFLMPLMVVCVCQLLDPRGLLGVTLIAGIATLVAVRPVLALLYAASTAP
ncbi:hypothetical protein [Streptomyces sp. NPDC002855]|uniref:hypothetical protein n=1 Tax=unclassified Streptomyces TaxID=2593676 RepID=UPI00332D0379